MSLQVFTYGFVILTMSLQVFTYGFVILTMSLQVFTYGFVIFPADIYEVYTQLSITYFSLHKFVVIST
jgi:hypothetical protein